jgi:hypothetical protein
MNLQKLARQFVLVVDLGAVVLVQTDGGAFGGAAHRVAGLVRQVTGILNAQVWMPLGVVVMVSWVPP